MVQPVIAIKVGWTLKIIEIKLVDNLSLVNYLRRDY